MLHIPGLYLASDDQMGRGVYTAQEVSKDDIIEVCPIIEISKTDLPMVHQTFLHDYYFQWDIKHGTGAIALGYGSLYNHRDKPNASFILDFDSKEIIFKATENIEAGKQIFIDYHEGQKTGSSLWFEIH